MEYTSCSESMFTVYFYSFLIDSMAVHVANTLQLKLALILLKKSLNILFFK